MRENLVGEVSKATGIPKSNVRAVFTALPIALAKLVKQQGYYNFSGLAVFEIVQAPDMSRIGRPLSREALKIKASGTFKKRVLK